MSNLAAVTALFEAQAAGTPDRVALRVGHKVLTYGWLTNEPTNSAIAFGWPALARRRSCWCAYVRMSA